MPETYSKVKCNEERSACGTAASRVAPAVKSPPAHAGDVKEVSLIPGPEDPLEEGMATHSSVLAWRIPWTEEPGGLQSMGSQRVGRD